MNNRQEYQPQKKYRLMLKNKLSSIGIVTAIAAYILFQSSIMAEDDAGIDQHGRQVFGALIRIHYPGLNPDDDNEVLHTHQQEGSKILVLEGGTFIKEGEVKEEGTWSYKDTLLKLTMDDKEFMVFQVKDNGKTLILLDEKDFIVEALEILEEIKSLENQLEGLHTEKDKDHKRTLLDAEEKHRGTQKKLQEALKESKLEANNAKKNAAGAEKAEQDALKKAARSEKAEQDALKKAARSEKAEQDALKKKAFAEKAKQDALAKAARSEIDKQDALAKKDIAEKAKQDALKKKAFAENAWKEDLAKAEDFEKDAREVLAKLASAVKGVKERLADKDTAQPLAVPAQADVVPAPPVVPVPPPVNPGPRGSGGGGRGGSGDRDGGGARASVVPVPPVVVPVPPVTPPNPGPRGSGGGPLRASVVPPSVGPSLDSGPGVIFGDTILEYQNGKPTFTPVPKPTSTAASVVNGFLKDMSDRAGRNEAFLQQQQIARERAAQQERERKAKLRADEVRRTAEWNKRNSDYQAEQDANRMRLKTLEQADDIRRKEEARQKNSRLGIPGSSYTTPSISIPRPSYTTPSINIPRPSYTTPSISIPRPSYSGPSSYYTPPSRSPFSRYY